jgi:hypothetical protein
MNRRWLRPILLAALLLVPAASPAADREFRQIVDRLSEHYQKRPSRGMGFLGFLANCFSPTGVSRLKMAVFEDVKPERPLAGDFEGFLKATVGSGFHPFVTVRSNRDGEHVYIYAREVGERMDLLMVSAQRNEAVVLKVRLAPEALEKWMSEPGKMARNSASGTPAS